MDRIGIDKPVYTVTVQRHDQRDYDVCWCRSLEEAQAKFSIFLASGKYPGDIMYVQIEEWLCGKRTTIHCLARC